MDGGYEESKKYRIENQEGDSQDNSNFWMSLFFKLISQLKISEKLLEWVKNLFHIITTCWETVFIAMPKSNGSGNITINPIIEK